METNKYYTPEIEEFYIGFEYEHKLHLIDKIPDNIIPGTIELPEGEWLKATFEYPFYHQGLINFSNFFRVKYLDQEDIESLGFIKSNSEILFARSSLTFWDKGNYCLGYCEADKHISIRGRYNHGRRAINWYNTNNTGEGILFDGIIKNKSELIKLMKQIGI
jgi:hypothetical protein